jgi:hypothetical protein
MLSLWNSISEQLEQLKEKEKKVTLHVKWNLLYKVRVAIIAYSSSEILPTQVYKKI